MRAISSSCVWVCCRMQKRASLSQRRQRRGALPTAARETGDTSSEADGDALGLKRRKGRQQICLKTRGEVAHLKRGSGEGGAQGIAGGTGYGQGKRVALLRTGHDDGEAYKRLRRMLAQQLQLVLPAGIPGGEYGGEIIQCSKLHPARARRGRGQRRPPCRQKAAGRHRQ